VVVDPDRSADDAAAAQAQNPPTPRSEELAAGTSPTEAASSPEPLEVPVAADAASEPVPPTQPEPVTDLEAHIANEEEDEDEGPVHPVAPLEYIDESADEENLTFDWYILKVAVNREDSIKDALLRRVRMNGLERFFHDVVVPTEDVKEFTKTGKARVVKRKLYPGYILINRALNDESWFVVRETPGIGDFTGAGGKPTPMLTRDVERILKLSRPVEEGPGQVKTAIPFKKGDRVRVKEGYFQNFEGDIDTIDEANGRVTVLVNIFGRSAPVELDHWQIENV
jgi:transcriptional antiterminator NusG